MPSNKNYLRHRTPQDDPRTEFQNGKVSHKKSASKRKSGLLMSFICLVACVLLIILFIGCYSAHMRIDGLSNFVDTIASKLGHQGDVRYAVVLDAGSTGSRVLAYKFYTSFVDGRLVLDEELFFETKPGLSNYHSEPHMGAKSIEKLILKANEFVPLSERQSTPLVLKATAGLRLLKQEEADNLLNSVREVFKKSGYSVNNDAVEIMDGIDEGIYSWFTINFLLGRLNGPNTVAALDLGGGSTQVTFAFKDKHKTPMLSSDHIHTISTGDAKIDVFTNSYLNLGLQAVRHAVFTTEHDNGNGEHISSCMNPIINSVAFRYGTNTYQVSGKPNPASTKEDPAVDFDACYRLVKQKTLPLVKPKPITLNQNQITAISYFFERAIETGMIDPLEGGEITLKELWIKTQEVCARANVDQPFMCLDLTYITTLLQDGYDLKPATKIKMYKRIDDHELSWALGCAYNLLASITRQKTH